MAYADFDYYINIYNGGKVSEDKFDYLAERASDFIDKITFNRLKNGDYPEFQDKIKKCCCALAEIVGDYEKSRNNSEIASETIGSYSVSYKNISAENYQSSMQNTAKQYLIHTGLMYRGVE